MSYAGPSLIMVPMEMVTEFTEQMSSLQIKSYIGSICLCFLNCGMFIRVAGQLLSSAEGGRYLHACVASRAL